MLSKGVIMGSGVIKGRGQSIKGRDQHMRESPKSDHWKKPITEFLSSLCDFGTHLESFRNYWCGKSIISEKGINLILCHMQPSLIFLEYAIAKESS